MHRMGCDWILARTSALTQSQRRDHTRLFPYPPLTWASAGNAYMEAESVARFAPINGCMPRANRFRISP